VNQRTGCCLEADDTRNMSRSKNRSDKRPVTSTCIVCFGDSLTAGFQSPTSENPGGDATPYGEWLEDLIGAWGQVRVSGICGEVTGEMVLRFRSDVLRHQPQAVVILGGTNDLGWNAAPREIMRNLVKMYELTRAGGGVPIPVTVPSIRMEGSEASCEARAYIADHLERRRQLNGLIQEYASSKQIACIDLFAATAEPDTSQLAAVYSNDGIHLTSAGYRLFAELAASVLSPLLASKKATP
jgi:acyl-CoA thioesterase I